MTAIAAVDRFVAWTPGRADDWTWIALRIAATRTRRAVKFGLAVLSYIIIMRAAFPRTLKILLIIGSIQIPFLPFDEIAAVIALVWLWLRYRRHLRICLAAARWEADQPHTGHGAVYRAAIKTIRAAQHARYAIRRIRKG